MIFWPHDGDLSQPPEISELRYRRPSVDYWESPAGDKATAQEGMWKRWQRVTGNPQPRKLPTPPNQSRSVVPRTQGSRRPSHFGEKQKQDRKTK